MTLLRSRPAAIFVIAFAAHVAFFLVMHSRYPEWEPAEIPRNGWFAIAGNLAAGRGYTVSHSLTYFQTATPVPTAARGPLPVLFLAVFIVLFSNPSYPILVATWLLSAGNAVLAYAVILKVARDRRLALVVGLLTGLHLSEMYVNTTFSYCSEPLFMHLLGWTVLLAVLTIERGRTWMAIATGGCLGAACLARPTVLLVPAIVVAFFVATRRGRGARLAAVACVAFALVQVPWVWRNQLVFHRPVLTSTLSGYGLYAAAVAARDDEIHLSGWSIDRAKLWKDMRAELTAVNRSVDDVDEVEFDLVLTNAARAIISTHRSTYLKNAALGAVGIWYWTNSGRGLYLVQNAVYYALALVGLVVAVRRREWALVSLLVLPAYAVAMHMPFVPQYRYILPFTPYVFACTAVGLLWLVDRRTGQRLVV
jgi:hypothetical protein